ncbi:hypothetical protein HAX54_021215 [Datura stramonium]|uniref:Uncharacterized protein n=1 Tax=Datura stramonium TaxID=4076 RepID=A0ABS8S5K3_DATST|nr:hypothetical protein [Datura stramonium]
MKWVLKQIQGLDQNCWVPWNPCMQKAKYDIGEEAVNRFSLPPEDKATLELAEWVDSAFGRASVEDAVCRAADGTSPVQELDFSSLRAQLGPLPAILLCVDIAATSAKSSNISWKLLSQKQLMYHKVLQIYSLKLKLLDQKDLPVLELWLWDDYSLHKATKNTLTWLTEYSQRRKTFLKTSLVGSFPKWVCSPDNVGNWVATVWDVANWLKMGFEPLKFFKVEEGGWPKQPESGSAPIYDGEKVAEAAGSISGELILSSSLVIAGRKDRGRGRNLLGKDKEASRVAGKLEMTTLGASTNSSINPSTLLGEPGRGRQAQPLASIGGN